MRRCAAGVMPWRYWFGRRRWMTSALPQSIEGNQNSRHNQQNVDTISLGFLESLLECGGLWSEVLRCVALRAEAGTAPHRGDVIHRYR